MNILRNFRKIHLIGILGVSMSGLAEHLVNSGIKVSGSDLNVSPDFSRLKGLGVSVTIGHDVSAVRTADAVVVSAAVPIDDPELLVARSLGIPILSRGELLGEIVKDYKKLIAVSGTHGKSTVTAMIGAAMIGAGKSPFVHVGARNAFVGRGDGEIAVVEACEYKGNFLHLHSDVAVVLNAEMDHPDCYNSFDDLRGAFSRFTTGVRPGGIVIRPQSLPECSAAKELVIGTDVIATELTEQNSYYSFTPIVNGNTLPRTTLSVAGLFNVTNALFALAAAVAAGCDAEGAVAGLGAFSGINKRFQRVGVLNGAEVIVDYAHHPTAINAVFDTARQRTKGHITLLFQPHTYSRTAALFDEFVCALSRANAVVVMKEYPARETPDMGKSALDLHRELCACGARSRYVTSVAEACEVVKRYAYSGDVILVLGAGDLGDEFVDFMRRR